MQDDTTLSKLTRFRQNCNTHAKDLQILKNTLEPARTTLRKCNSVETPHREKIIIIM